MASCLTSTVRFDIFYSIAFKLLFLPICQEWADTFASWRQLPVKIKGKTLTDFSSVIAGLKFVRSLCSVSTQQMGACLGLDFAVAFYVLPPLEVGYGFVAVLPIQSCGFLVP